MKYSTTEVAQSLSVYPGVVIIGAGTSIAAGIPLVKQLANILWKIIPKQGVVFNELQTEFKTTSNDIKVIINDNYDDVIKAFKIISKYPDLINLFKQEFKNHNDTKLIKNTKFHRALVKLLHDSLVKCVISLNWDTLLESAWEDEYGTSLTSRLIKPHGDVNKLNENWILPHLEGNIKETEINQIQECINNNIVQIIIIGYSEQDKAIVQKCIAPLEQIYRTIRIYPGSNDLDSTADDFMQDIISKVKLDKLTGWQRINFSNQQGIEYAVYGSGLDQHHVLACPKLPIFNSAFKKLKAFNYLDIVGRSGTGKSITALQIAYEFNQLGYEIIKAKDIINITIPKYNHPTILIIDNAQNKIKLIKKLREHLNSNLKMICIYTDIITIPSVNKVEISSKQAVKTLYKFYKKNISIIEPIVLKINNDMGIGENKKSYLKFLELAKKEPTPYMFNYVLRNEAKNISYKIDVLKEHNFDKTVLIIALYQVLNTDNAIPLSAINTIKSSLNDLNINTYKLKKHLCDNTATLKYEQGNKYRMVHIQAASNYIKFCLKSNSSFIKSVFYLYLQNNQFSLLGVSWFLETLRTLPNKVISKLFTQQEFNDLYKQIFKHINNLHFFTAINQLEYLNNNHSFRHDMLLALTNRINKSVVEEYYDISKFINLYINQSENDDVLHDLNFIQSNLDYNLIIDNFNSADISKYYNFGNLFQSLFNINNINYNDVILNKIDIELICNNISFMEQNDIYPITLVFNTLSIINPNFNNKLLTLITDKIVKFSNFSIIKTFQKIDFNIFKNKSFSNTYINNISLSQLVEEIENIEFDDIQSVLDLLYLIKDKNHQKYLDLISLIDLSKISILIKYKNTNIVKKLLTVLESSELIYV